VVLMSMSIPLIKLMDKILLPSKLDLKIDVLKMFVSHVILNVLNVKEHMIIVQFVLVTEKLTTIVNVQPDFMKILNLNVEDVLINVLLVSIITFVFNVELVT
jgi:hypothetical protein